VNSAACRPAQRTRVAVLDAAGPLSVIGGRQLNQKQNTAPTPEVSAASKLVAHLFIIAEYAGHQEGSL